MTINYIKNNGTLASARVAAAEVMTAEIIPGNAEETMICIDELLADPHKSVSNIIVVDPVKGTVTHEQHGYSTAKQENIIETVEDFRISAEEKEYLLNI